VERVTQPQLDLHVCLECSSDLVHPVQSEESGSESWSVLLRCPNCDVHRRGVFSQQVVDAFEEELDRGADVLTRDYKSMVRANMAQEIERFVAALKADAILPEDF
jgi:hypothetical protein